MESEDGRMKMKCPHCSQDFDGSLEAAIDDGQKLKLDLTKEDGEHFFSAQTIGGILLQTDKALRATARSLGGAVHILIAGVRMDIEKGTIGFDLAVMDKKARPARRRK